MMNSLTDRFSRLRLRLSEAVRLLPLPRRALMFGPGGG